MNDPAGNGRPGGSKGNDGHMNPWGRLVASGAAGVLAACALSSCGSSPAARKTAAGKGIGTTTTTTTTLPSTSTSAATTTTAPGATVPAVIGLKIAAARAALRAAGLPPVSLNAACNRGTLASQSVVTSLSVAGRAPDPRVGAVPLDPGATVPPETRVGVTWSGCYGNGSPVPAVVGLTHALARRRAPRGRARVVLLLGRPADNDHDVHDDDHDHHDLIAHLHHRTRGHDHDDQAGQAPRDRADAEPGARHGAHTRLHRLVHDAGLPAVSDAAVNGGPPAVGSATEPLVLSSARGRWVIAATVLGSGIATLDANVVGIALPAIARSLHTGLGVLQWVVTGYALTLAALLLLGGSLGDRFGRRRIFAIGVAWFAVASACCGVSPNADVLIAPGSSRASAGRSSRRPASRSCSVVPRI